MASVSVNRNSVLWGPGSSVLDKQREDFFFNHGAGFLLETRTSFKFLALHRLSFSSVDRFLSLKA